MSAQNIDPGFHLKILQPRKSTPYPTPPLPVGRKYNCIDASCHNKEFSTIPYLASGS